MNQLKKFKINTINEALKKLSYPVKDYSLTPPKQSEFGDLSSNIALLLSKELKMSPMDIANVIASELNKNSNKYVSSISVTNPGFINFKIKDDYFRLKIESILNEGPK